MPFIPRKGVNLYPIMLRNLLILCCLISACTLVAQQPFFKNYQVRDGLPSNTVYFVFQDSKGYIWLCTDIGVSRFDGVRCSNFTIADVLSHLGSGAVITRRRLDDTLAGRDTPDDYAPAIWDEWNAKQPAAQRDDALAADAALIARLQSVTAEQRNAFASAMGPITLDFDQFVAMRLNEHALHTWDIETDDNPTATTPTQPASRVADNHQLIAQHTTKAFLERGG